MAKVKWASYEGSRGMWIRNVSIVISSSLARNGRRQMPLIDAGRRKTSADRPTADDFMRSIPKIMDIARYHNTNSTWSL